MKTRVTEVQAPAVPHKEGPSEEASTIYPWALGRWIPCGGLVIRQPPGTTE